MSAAESVIEPGVEHSGMDSVGTALSDRAFVVVLCSRIVHLDHYHYDRHVVDGMGCVLWFRAHTAT